MNRFALLTLYRSLTRHKLYALLNIGGLAVGIAVFLILGLYVRFETGYEKWLPRHAEIQVVQSIWNMPGSAFDGASNYSMGGLLDQLRQDFPGIVGTRVRGGEGSGSVVRDGVATTEAVAQVDPNFFEVFDLPMVRGQGGGSARQSHRRRDSREHRPQVFRRWQSDRQDDDDRVGFACRVPGDRGVP